MLLCDVVVEVDVVEVKWESPSRDVVGDVATAHHNRLRPQFRLPRDGSGMTSCMGSPW